MEIVADYPNSHTFTYYSEDMVKYPLCFAYARGVFKDGTLATRVVGDRGEASTSSVMQKVSQRTTRMNAAQNECLTVGYSDVE